MDNLNDVIYSCIIEGFKDKIDKNFSRVFKKVE